jgi:hypothetical protein
MTKIRRVHFIVGVLAIIAFLGTGVYMRENFPNLYQTNESIRSLFRANHIYILFSSLLNLVLGLYLSPNGVRWRRTLRRLGSLFLLLAPFLLLWAFINEPPQASPMRPLTFLGVGLAFTGTALHFAARPWRKGFE